MKRFFALAVLAAATWGLSHVFAARAESSALTRSGCGCVECR